jgi:hypothetical protein
MADHDTHHGAVMVGGIVLRTGAASVVVEKHAQGHVVVRSASPANVIIASVGRQGPPGPEGPEGREGPPGSGVADPGDLTLYFANALIG